MVSSALPPALPSLSLSPSPTDPPRKGEYADTASADAEEEDDEQEFEYAEHLVRYIREQYGDWFCVGVAGECSDGWHETTDTLTSRLAISGYPTPHPDSPSPQADIQFLSAKVNAGADFIITQLFYDVDGFLDWVGDVRSAGEKGFTSPIRWKDGLINHVITGVNVPIIPGIMPIQNYASFRRLTNLCRCPVPDRLIDDLEKIKVSRRRCRPPLILTVCFPGGRCSCQILRNQPGNRNG